ncbi:ABC transporter permease [Halorhabdus rudnickae]|uniref:ABC transporter permease n=1 Tax=Halorhabdus rudnickae TaxID=1775544 RepID=UPI001AEF9E4F|nr:ABC transporter permease [Halorhabdus rudnickae]
MSYADRLRKLRVGPDRKWPNARTQRLALGVVGGLLAAVLVVPVLSFLVVVGLPDLGSFTDPDVLSAVRVSLLTAPVATLVATLFGVPLAYVLAHERFPGKRLVEALVVLPLVTPPVVGGTMLLTVVGRYTPIGGAAAALGVNLTGGYLGVIVAQTFVAAPFLVVTARSGFAAIDEDIERAARNLGKGPIETVRTVSLPLARGPILAGVVLTFGRALGEFGATMMVAYQPRTLPTQIWTAYIAGGVEATAPLVVVLLTAGLGVVAALQYVGQSIGFDT